MRIPHLLLFWACVLSAVTTFYGCTQPAVLKGSGVVTPAPEGYQRYCDNNPKLRECGGTQ